MKDQKSALLVASFGTAHADSREKTIAPLEERIRTAFPARRFYRCYTSPTVRRLMERREGIRSDGPVEALERMAADGMEDILVFATHVIPGIESERIARQVQDFRGAHPKVRVHLTKPLLWEDEDYDACAEILLQEYGEFLHGNEDEDILRRISGDDTGEMRGEKPEFAEKRALIFFGHGTQHAGDACYERLEQTMRRKWEAMRAESASGDRNMAEGNQNYDTNTVAKYVDACGDRTASGKQIQNHELIYVVTVEGSRTAADIVPELKADGVAGALILPFLLTAGEHVMHDMAGDEPGSVKNILRAAGIEAVPVKKGLGEYERLREYYVRRYIGKV